jgi:ketosteroid isomerase-like protein
LSKSDNTRATPADASASADTPEMAEARALVTRFYEAFARLDSEAMLDCLHPEITFSDPLFPNLRKGQVFEMWRMLIASAARHPKDFKLTYEFVFLEDRKAQVHWQANYRYGGQRKVRNKVLATFTFWDGLIVRHVDGFNFYTWARQALGLLGVGLGWHRKFRASVQAAAAKQLSVYMGRPLTAKEQALSEKTSKKT